jgi:cytochrome c-type biogenesis protein CcsB
MSKTEGILLLITLLAYFFSFLLYLTEMVFKKEKAGRMAWKVFVTAFVFQTATLSWRWYLSGRPPVMVSYEHYQLGTWFTGIATVAGGLVYAGMRNLSMFSAVAILFMLGLGIGTEAEMIPLRPPYKSNWLFIHIGFAWFAWGCFVVATIMAVIYIIKTYRKKIGAFLQKFPTPEVLDELMLKFILFGFICQGLMIAAGAIWAHQLWGRYWGWDPVETWSLVCWLVYGLVLHFRLMMGWRGVKIAVLIILSLITAIIYFWGIGFLPQTHTSMMLT